MSHEIGVYVCMLPVTLQGQSGPLLIMLHWLGGGAQTWKEVGHGLSSRGVRFTAIDAPGFGDAANLPASDVRSAVDAIADTIRSLRAGTEDAPWILGGHSMGGKFAAILARRALDGEAGLQNLGGLVLISPSPAGPEPIKDARREEQLKTFGSSDPDQDAYRKSAEKWLDGNTERLPIPLPIRERAIRGITGNNARAYRAWFLVGSKEDWSDRVGTLSLPAIVMAGSDETSLGEDAQRELTMPHLPQAEFVLLDGVKHLAPLDRPGEVIELITQFLTTNGFDLNTPTSQPGPATDSLMHSERTAPQTLALMTERLEASGKWNRTPTIFTPAEFRTLRRLAEVVVPDAGFDLAGCLDAQFAENKNDGWRYADLPGDKDAWKRGLVSLDHAAQREYGVSFIALHPGQQDELLHKVAKGEVGPGVLGALRLGKGADAYSAADFKQWFEDVRGEFTRFYMADPRTMDRIGYTGFADDLGFTQIQLGQLEEFER